MSSPQEKSEKSTKQNIEQQRAKFALDFILNSKAKHEDLLSCINALPAMIHMNGLGQAMAFYKSKSKKNDVSQDKSDQKDKVSPHHEIYFALNDWLCVKRKVFGDSIDDLMIGITKNNMNDYQIAQSEAQAFLVWLKNFARAYFTEEVVINENQ